MSRNRSLNYEDHVNLIRKKAKLYHSRLLAAQIMSVDFDDVMGELGVAFTKAVKGYKTDSEYAFTTYLGTCMQNHFNKYASRLMLEQFGVDRVIDGVSEVSINRGLGYISIEELTSVDEDGASMGYAMFEDDTPGPERQMDARQRLELLYQDQTLLPETRAYIGMLANPSMEIPPAVRARLESRAGEIRQEIEARWGVKLSMSR